MPLCGGGIQPDDWVTLEIASASGSAVTYTPVRASRPGIAEQFTRSLALGGQPLIGPAMTVRVRCRVAPSSSYDVLTADTMPIEEWLAERGVYPAVIGPTDGPDDVTSRLDILLEERERLLGPNSPFLIFVLLHRSRVQSAQAALTGNAGYRERARESLTRARRIAVDNAAPPDVLAIFDLEMSTLVDRPSKASDAAAFMRTTAEAVMRLASTSPDMAVRNLGQFVKLNVSPADKLAIADATLALLQRRGLKPTDPRMRSALLQKIDLLQEMGNSAAIPPIARTLGLPPDLCGLLPKPVTPKDDAGFSSDDYPRDMTRLAIQGTDTVEFSIGADGKPRDVRVIAASPPEMFDAVTLSGIGQRAFDPPEVNGRPGRCRGHVQTVVWQLPGD